MPATLEDWNKLISSEGLTSSAAIVGSSCFVQNKYFAESALDLLPERKEDIYTIYAVTDDFSNNEAITVQMANHLTFPPLSIPPPFEDGITFTTGVSYPEKVTKQYRSRHASVEELYEYLTKSNGLKNSTSLYKEMMGSDPKISFWYHQAFAMQTKTESGEKIYVIDPSYHMDENNKAIPVELNEWKENIKMLSPGTLFSNPIPYGEKLTLDKLDATQNEIERIKAKNSMQIFSNYAIEPYMKRRLPDAGGWNSNYFVVDVEEEPDVHAKKWLKFNEAINTICSKEHNAFSIMFEEKYQQSLDDYFDLLAKELASTSQRKEHLAILQKAQEKINHVKEELKQKLPGRRKHLQELITKKVNQSLELQ